MTKKSDIRQKGKGNETRYKNGSETLSDMCQSNIRSHWPQRSNRPSVI